MASTSEDIVDTHDEEWETLTDLACTLVILYYATYVDKTPVRTSIRSGHMLIMEILNDQDKRCYQDFRMNKSVFLELCDELQSKYGLKPTREMSIHEQVGIFLITCAHNFGNRMLQELFIHSGRTIHDHFHRVLKAVKMLAADIIRPHPEYNNGVGYHRPQNPRYNVFEDCIGAIDGTHIKARLPRGSEIPFIGRKMYPTQNILAVVDFNMCFTFVVAGWEGAAHDSRILSDTLRRVELKFPMPENNKYYLVDAGYAHTPGFMAPYKGQDVRYHLQEFRRAQTSSSRRPRGKKEKFNFLHSSCRNIVERTFGVWKARWSILRNMNVNYSFATQVDIVLATMGVHNYIRKKQAPDVAFDLMMTQIAHMSKRILRVERQTKLLGQHSVI